MSIFKHLTKYKFFSKALHSSAIPLCWGLNKYLLTDRVFDCVMEPILKKEIYFNPYIPEFPFD